MTHPSVDAKGLFGSLFDLNFTSFITLRFLKVIYLVLMVFIGLGALVFFVSLASQGAVTAIIGLVLIPVGALVYLVMLRVSLEVVAVLFRIGEDMKVLAGRNAEGPGYHP